MSTNKLNCSDDSSINPITLAKYEFSMSPRLLYKSLLHGLLIIKYSNGVDYTIPHHLWLVEYLQAGMILLGVGKAVSFLRTDIDKCIQIFSDAIKL